MMVGRGAGLLVALLAACSPAASRPEATPPLPPLSSLPPVSSAPAAPPAPATAAAVVPPAPPLYPALTSADAVALYPVSNALIVEKDLHFAVAEGDDFVLRPELSRGFKEGHQGYLRTLIGHYPDALWLVYRHADRSGQLDESHDEVYRFQGTRWQMIDSSPADHEYLGLWEAPAGCLLGLLSSGRPHGGHHTTAANVRVIDCKGHTPILPGLRHGLGPGMGSSISEVAGSPWGDLHLVDHEDTRAPGQPPKYSPYRLELWRHDDPGPRSSAIPLPPEVPATAYAGVLALVPRGRDDVYVVMSVRERSPDLRPDEKGRPLETRILRFDGSAWTPVESPPVLAYDEVEVGDDGTLALVSETTRRGEVATAVWRRPGQPWSILSLPPDPGGKGPSVTRLVLRSADDVWVAGWVPRRGVTVFHSRRPAGVLQFGN
jgi:hypothetical protein